MTKRIEKILKNALINNGKMEYALYEYELEEVVDELKFYLARDHDDYIFCITENTNDVAMVLIDKLGEVYINESARDKLMETWQHAYPSNMKKMIPILAEELSQDMLPINGVKELDIL